MGFDEVAGELERRAFGNGGEEDGVFGFEVGDAGNIGGEVGTGFA